MIDIDATRTETIKMQIRKCWTDNRKHMTSRWLPMTWIREYTAGYGTRQEIDQVLRTMYRDREIFTTEETNQKALTWAEREAALPMGGQHDHYVTFER